MPDLFVVYNVRGGFRRLDDAVVLQADSAIDAARASLGKLDFSDTPIVFGGDPLPPRVSVFRAEKVGEFDLVPVESRS